MTTIHVLVSSRDSDEQAYIAACPDGAELYRFATPDEAFRRFANVRGHVDVIVVCDVGGNDPMPERLVYELASGSLAASPFLEQMQIWAVGTCSRRYPRVRSAASLDEVLQTVAGGQRTATGAGGDSSILENVMSSVWRSELSSFTPRIDREQPPAAPQPAPKLKQMPRALKRQRMSLAKQAAMSAAPRVPVTGSATPAGDNQPAPQREVRKAEGPRIEAPQLEPARPFMLSSRGEFHGQRRIGGSAAVDTNASYAQQKDPTCDQLRQMTALSSGQRNDIVAAPELTGGAQLQPLQPGASIPLALDDVNTAMAQTPAAPAVTGAATPAPAPANTLTSASAPFAAIDPVMTWSVPPQQVPMQPAQSAVHGQQPSIAMYPAQSAQSGYIGGQVAGQMLHAEIAAQPMQVQAAPSYTTEAAQPVAASAAGGTAGGKRGRFARMRDRVRADEHVGAVPNASAVAVASGSQGNFAAPNAVMDRLAAADAVAFG